MSRLGKQLINIPAGVTVSISGGRVDIKGPKGSLSLEMRSEIKAVVEDNKIVVSIAKDSRDLKLASLRASKAYWGLTRSLIANMVLGVTQGFEKKMELVGVGYRAKSSADGISLTVGFSHPVEFKAPAGIKLDVIDNQNITISGIDKQMVGATAANIRKIRKPEPYKGKGIKYSDEVVRRKVGKSGKV